MRVDSSKDMDLTPKIYSNGFLIRRMLGMTWHFRRGCMRVVAMQLLMIAFSLAGIALTGLAIDVIRYHALSPTGRDIAGKTVNTPHYPLGFVPPADWSAMRIVVILAIGIVLFACIYAIVRYFETVLRARLILDVVVSLRTRVYNKMQRLSFRFFDSHDSGSMINRATSDVQGIRMFIEGVIIESIALIVALLFYIGYMMSISVPLTIACLATTPIIWLLTVQFTRKVKPTYREVRDEQDKLIDRVSENIQGVHVVKGFAREPEEIAKFGRQNAFVRDKQNWVFGRLSIYAPLVEFLTFMNMVVLLGYGGYMVTQGQIELGQGLIVFASILRIWTTNIQSIANIANSMQNCLSRAERVFEVLDEKLEVESPSAPELLGRARGDVTFEHVSFSYNGVDMVLNDVSLEVPAGRCVAVLGATGAGKSTLLSLIPRFYDAKSGRVTIDGHDVRSLDLNELRKNVGIVFQESFLFSMSVARNIAFGHPEAPREQIEHAARIARAHDFITQLPKGYDTIIGENGADLSGGQRQRLSIARAILLEPAILLLDDPTAAVDPDTEHHILDAMDRAMVGRTTFVIAHRLSTLRRADMVVVMEAGRIIQIGTHDELMQSSGHYRDVAQLQIADLESRQLLEGLGHGAGSVPPERGWGRPPAKTHDRTTEQP